MVKHDDSRLKCSFCGKTQDQVKKLIAGPEVYICDECVELCNEILDEEFFETVSTIQTEMITMNGFRIMGGSAVEKTIRQRNN